MGQAAIAAQTVSCDQIPGVSHEEDDGIESRDIESQPGKAFVHRKIHCRNCGKFIRDDVTDARWDFNLTADEQRQQRMFA